MKQPALIPVPFSSLSRLIATASRFCGRESTAIKIPLARRELRAGDVLRLALLAPEIRHPIDVNALVVARTFQPLTVSVRYTLADLAQMEFALGRLYAQTEPRLPCALDVSTFHKRRCRLCELSARGATFDVEGELTPSACAPDSEAELQLPHQNGKLQLKGHVGWVTPRQAHSRLYVVFDGLGSGAKKCLDDIVYRFRLGAAPWTPKLLAQGL